MKCNYKSEMWWMITFDLLGNLKYIISLAWNAKYFISYTSKKNNWFFQICMIYAIRSWCMALTIIYHIYSFVIQLVKIISRNEYYCFPTLTSNVSRCNDKKLIDFINSMFFHNSLFWSSFIYLNKSNQLVCKLLSFLTLFYCELTSVNFINSNDVELQRRHVNHL